MATVRHHYSPAYHDERAGFVAGDGRLRDLARRLSPANGISLGRRRHGMVTSNLVKRAL